jgi:hypothetical protein
VRGMLATPAVGRGQAIAIAGNEAAAVSGAERVMASVTLRRGILVQATGESRWRRWPCVDLPGAHWGPNLVVFVVRDPDGRPSPGSIVIDGRTGELLASIQWPSVVAVAHHRL